ncbi:MAG: PIG-L family deacetylase [Thermoanaerobaculia bacterium]|nr:PIG-L family deacetylase [Thermoanaerobaculia bacterium]
MGGLGEVRPDVLYLSPHLDDVVLSCGGTAFRQAKSGLRVVVLTLFTRDLEDDPTNLVLQQVYGRMDLRPAEAMTVRREEDRRACGRLGATPVHWGLDEALGRHPGLPSLAALFEEPPGSDQVVVERLADRFRDLEDVPEVAAPVGWGGHMDHRLVRRAAEAVFGQRLRFYEDFPYVLTLDEADLGPEVRGLEPEVERLDAEDLAARIEAIAAYRSQVSSLFGSRVRRLLVPGRSIAARVRRHVRSVGGERFWVAAS